MKRDLERRQRETESYNVVLERALADTEVDFDDGFGMRSDEQAYRRREARETATGKRRNRLRRLGDS